MALAGGLLIAITYGLARFVFGLFLPQIRSELGLDPTISGIVGALPYLSYMIAVLLAPAFSNWLGVRLSTALVGVLALIGLFTIAQADGALFLALGVTVCGISTGLSSPILAKGVQHFVRSDRTGRVNATINAATSAGIILAALAAFWWTDAWRWAYSGFGILAAMAALILLVTLPDDAKSAPVSKSYTDEDIITRKTWRDLIILGGLAGVMGLVSSVYWIFAPDFAVNEGQLTSGQSSLIWLAVGLGGLYGTWAGDLIDKYGQVISHSLSLATLSAALLILMAAPDNFLLTLISAVFFGASYMTLTGLYLVASVRITPNQPSFGPVMPLMGASTGQMAGSPVAGWVISNYSYDTAFGIYAGIGLITALLSLAIVRHRYAPKGF